MEISGKNAYATVEVENSPNYFFSHEESCLYS